MNHILNKQIENIEGEEWFPINEANGDYLISNYCRVKSVQRVIKRIDGVKKTIKEKILTQARHPDGYSVVAFTINGIKVKRYVHRLFATQFIPNPENKPQVNHKNGITNDNSIKNLEWVNNSENNKHAYRELGRKHSRPQLGKCGKLHHRSKRVLCVTTGIEYESTRLAGAALNIGSGNISHACLGHRKEINGLIFKYV